MDYYRLNNKTKLSNMIKYTEDVTEGLTRMHMMSFNKWDHVMSVQSTVNLTIHSCNLNITKTKH